MKTPRAFTPDYERHDGVRPFNVYLLRLLFTLVFVFVGFDSWSGILKHQGSWDHVRAAAVCMWAAFALLAFIGIFRPLKMLPLIAFEIHYKIVWLIAVAYPLWSTGRLAGSPAERMTKDFLWVILPIVAMPWGYFFKTYISSSKERT